MFKSGTCDPSTGIVDAPTSPVSSPVASPVAGPTTKTPTANPTRWSAGAVYMYYTDLNKFRAHRAGEVTCQPGDPRVTVPSQCILEHTPVLCTSSRTDLSTLPEFQDLPVYWPNSRVAPSMHKLADRYQDMFKVAGVRDVGLFSAINPLIDPQPCFGFWTGCSKEGWLDETKTCDDWTSREAAKLGATGAACQSDARWLNFANVQCSGVGKVMCMCLGALPGAG